MSQNELFDQIELAAWVRQTLRQPERESLNLWRLRLRLEQARLTDGLDRLICLDDIFIDQYPYQLQAALRALRDMRGRALLADEVGLGKTIEAGIVMKELIERGLAQSILIIVPASLTGQWHEEMQLRFGESFTILTRPQQISAHPPDTPVRWLCSLERAKGAQWAELLLQREYDLLIVDEAHKLKNRSTQAYRFVNQMRSRYLLMLTATPVHNDLMELYSLVSLLRPGYLGTPAEFKRRFIYGGARRRVVMWSTAQINIKYNWARYRAWLLKLRGRVQNPTQADFAAIALPDQPSPRRQGANLFYVSKKDTKTGQQPLAELLALLAQGYRVADGLLIRNPQTGLTHAFRVEAELAETDKTVPRQPAALRRLLNEVMIRNRRSQAGVQLPRRRAEILYLDMSPPERALYDGTTAFVRGHAGESERWGAGGMVLLTLQREVCSSPAAVAQTLHKLADQPTYQSAQEALRDLTQQARRIEVGCKALAIGQILERLPGKWLIFTDYIATMQTLSQYLDAMGIPVIVFHGGLPAQHKQEAVRRFRHQARVMISTESGAEGHNLQFCHQMINLDLPWNPMRIEQRIGRIHRLGQTQEVLIVNMAGRDTIESVILDLLARKIRMFELVVGELDLLLGALSSPKSFDALLRDAFLSSTTDQELSRKIAELEALIDASRQIFEDIHRRSDALSDLLAGREEAWNEGLEEAE